MHEWQIVYDILPKNSLQLWFRNWSESISEEGPEEILNISKNNGYQWNEKQFVLHP